MKTNIKSFILSVTLLILTLCIIYIVISHIKNSAPIPVETVELTYPETTHMLDHEVEITSDIIKFITTNNSGTYYILGRETLFIYSEDMQKIEEKKLSDEVQVVNYIEDLGLILAAETSITLLDHHGEFVKDFWTVDRKSLITSLDKVEHYLFLLDAFNKRVIRLNLETNEIKSFYRYDGKRFIIPSPHFEIVKHIGNTMWITDPGRHKVIQFDTNLNPISSFGEGVFTLEGFVGCCNPSNLSITSRGEIITSETGEKRVKIYSYSGKYLGLVEYLNRDEGEIIDLLVDRDNRIHLLVGRFWRVYSEKDK